MFCENSVQDINRFTQVTKASTKRSPGFCFNAKSQQVIQMQAFQQELPVLTLDITIPVCLARYVWTMILNPFESAHITLT
jgi:hypothetical protein